MFPLTVLIHNSVMFTQTEELKRKQFTKRSQPNTHHHQTAGQDVRKKVK